MVHITSEYNKDRNGIEICRSDVYITDVLCVIDSKKDIKELMKSIVKYAKHNEIDISDLLYGDEEGW